MTHSFVRSVSTLALLAAVCAGATQAADEKERLITLEEGHIRMLAPAGWERKVPRFRIIEHEFAVSPVAGDSEAVRITFMGAGGDVKTNIDRWKASFDKAEATTRELSIAGQTVHLVDIGGAFKDMPAGPFAGGKTIVRENYRMLGAIIVTKDFGSYFVKLVGPKATVAAQEKAFLELLNSLSVK